MTADLIVSGPMVRQSIMAAGHDGTELLSSWQREKYRQQQEEDRTKIFHSKTRLQ
jgi:hypothetical protein